MRGLFGDSVIDQTSVVWGVDEEGELNGCYCRRGILVSVNFIFFNLQVNLTLWYAAGDFGISRFYSKQLALEIKAIELGLLTL
ncbi:hypothetical protein B0H10DRAFT_2226822 [Mycena sp. CBHHK59/15]|nr:hypothetical protein B0H10DRAFT_2226822 [Mycena sp. CBHHK59/15]